MHNSIFGLTAWLWYGAMATQPALFLIIFWRGAHKKNPWFHRYLLTDFTASVFLLFVQDYREYVACFYLLAIFIALCKSCILVDVVHQIFAPYETLPRGTMARLMVAMFVAIGAFSGCIFASKATGLDPAMTFLRTADSALAAGVFCGFWVVVIYARKLGLYWRSQTVGIAVGFLFHSSVQTATKLVLLHAHPGAAIWVRNIGQMSYIVALFIWMGFMLVPEPIYEFNKEDADAAFAIVGNLEDKMREISRLVHVKEWRQTPDVMRSQRDQTTMSQT